MFKVKRRKAYRKYDKGKKQKLNSKTTTQCWVYSPTVKRLPPELLEIIFKNLESPEDLLNCWNTSPAWAAALKSTDFYFKMTLPFVLSYLNPEDLLNCSFVSKSWNAAIDCIQNTEDFDESDPEFNERLFLELDSDNFTDFIDTFGLMTNNDSGEKIVEVNHVITVLYRRSALSLSFDDMYILDADPEPEQINQQMAVDHKNLLQCLSYYGHLVHRLVLTISDEHNVSCLDKMKLVQSCLTRTPNLRYLNLELFNISENVVQNQNQLTAFNEYIAENPWPPLEHLKVLKMDRNICTGGGTEYVTIANAYASQLLCFNFGYETLLPQSLVWQRFSNLQKIYFSLNDYFSTINLQQILRLTWCSPKHLILVFYSHFALDRLYIVGIVKAVNFVSSSLETLEFRIKDFQPKKHLDITEFDQLRLPTLRELKLDTFGFPMVNFLQSVCPALQKLTAHSTVSQFVDFRDSTKEAEAEMYHDLYLEHTFWKILANIRHVDVAYTAGTKRTVVKNKRTGRTTKNVIYGENVRKVYTRDGYEAKNESVMGIDNQSLSSKQEETCDKSQKTEK